MFSIVYPECYTEPHPIKPTPCNKTARKTYRDRKLEQEGGSQRAVEDLAETRSQSAQGPCPHPSARMCLATVEKSIKDLEHARLCRYKDWVKEHGVSGALDRQRKELAITVDESSAFLYSEAQRIKAEIEKGFDICDGHCFDDVCSERKVDRTEAGGNPSGILDPMDDDMVSQTSRVLYRDDDYDDHYFKDNCWDQETDTPNRDVYTAEDIAALQAKMLRDSLRQQRMASDAKDFLMNWRVKSRDAEPPFSQELIEDWEPTEEAGAANVDPSML
jgi:hypothetical protein